MKLKELATDLRTYLYLIGIVGVVLITVTSFAKLPDKVKKVESKVTDNSVKITEVEHNIDKFMAVQSVYNENLLKVLEKVTDK